MAKLPLIIDKITPNFFNKEEMIFELSPSPENTESNSDPDPKPLRFWNSPVPSPVPNPETPRNTVLSPEPSSLATVPEFPAPIEQEDLPAAQELPDTTPEELPDEFPEEPHPNIDEVFNMDRLRLRAQELCDQNPDTTPYDFITLTLIDHVQGFRFLHIPKHTRKDLIAVLNDMRSSGSIIKICDDAERTRDLANFTPEQLELIESYSTRLYNLRSNFLKGKQITLPSHAFMHIRKQSEATAKIAKSNRVINATVEKEKKTKTEIEFKSAYAEWVNTCRDLKMQKQQAESKLIEEKGQLEQRLNVIRSELKSIADKFIAPPAPSRSSFGLD